MVATVSVLGSHSALEVCDGAKKFGMNTVVVCKKGRERTYAHHYKSRVRGKEHVGIVDNVVVLDDFKQICAPDTIEKLEHSIFVPNRSFAVYVGYDAIEHSFPIPMFGNRYLLKAEERWAKNNQYDIMRKAGIKYPRTYRAEDIDRPVIVKVNEAKRTYERAFFIVSSYEEYKERAAVMIKEGVITEEALSKATIEELLVGPQFNFNFFYSPLYKELELIGIDMRRQTNNDGMVNFTYDVQAEVLKHVRPTRIEVGHVSCTLRESLLEKVFEMGERVVEATKTLYPHGIIGPFALQCSIVEDDGEVPAVFDISFRMPGSPGVKFTPYTSYLFGREVSMGERVAGEIREAVETNDVEKITT